MMFRVAQLATASHAMTSPHHGVPASGVRTVTTASTMMTALETINPSAPGREKNLTR